MYYTGQQYNNFYGQPTSNWLELQPLAGTAVATPAPPVAVAPLAPAYAAPIAYTQPVYLSQSPPQQVTYVVASTSPPASRSPPPASTDEDLKRCSLCGRYYHNSRDKCTSHPGRYQSAFISQSYGGGGKQWTCCKSPDENAPGCKVGYHSEDKQASRSMSEYKRLVDTLMPAQKSSQVGLPQSEKQGPSASSPPAAGEGLLVDLTWAGIPSPTSTATSTSLPNKKLYPSLNDSPASGRRNNTLKISAEQQAPDGKHFKHFVKKTDTLTGIALQYNIKKKALLDANKGLSHDNLYAYYELLIPIEGNFEIEVVADMQDPAAKQRQAQRLAARFRRTEGATSEESSFYLGYYEDYNAALKEHKADVEWERQHGHKFKATEWKPSNKSR